MTSTATTPTAAEIIPQLTAKGRDAMTAIGLGQVSFFDEGIVEGSGSWGEILTEDLGHKSSGVLNRLRDLGLWEVHTNQEPGDPGAWWSLTALGAAVAQQLAEGSDAEQAAAQAAENNITTKKESKTMTNTATKKTETKAPAKRAYKTPKGYEVKWQHGGHDLLKKADAAVKGPEWYTACNEHGDLHEAKTAKEAESFGVLKVRATWCKGEHKAPAKKAAKPAAKKEEAPAKAPTAAEMRKAIVATGELTRDQAAAHKGSDLKAAYDNLVVKAAK